MVFILESILKINVTYIFLVLETVKYNQYKFKKKKCNSF